MRFFCFLLSLLALAGTASLAQAQQLVSVKKGHQPRQEKHAKVRGTDDYVLMKDGVMLAMQGGSVVSMSGPVTMRDGTKVLPDGSVTQPDGKQLMLHNGQYVLMDGRVVNENQLKGKRKE